MRWPAACASVSRGSTPGPAPTAASSEPERDAPTTTNTRPARAQARYLTRRPPRRSSRRAPDRGGERLGRLTREAVARAGDDDEAGVGQRRGEAPGDRQELRVAVPGNDRGGHRQRAEAVPQGL